MLTSFSFFHFSALRSYPHASGTFLFLNTVTKVNCKQKKRLICLIIFRVKVRVHQWHFSSNKATPFYTSKIVFISLGLSIQKYETVWIILLKLAPCSFHVFLGVHLQASIHRVCYIPSRLFSTVISLWSHVCFAHTLNNFSYVLDPYFKTGVFIYAIMPLN